MPSWLLTIRPGRSPSMPVSSIWYALFRSRTTVSKCSIDRLTLSKRSGLGNSSTFSLHSCSMVSNMFFSFNNTNHNLCKSEFDLIRSSSRVHDRPLFTSLWPQFFLSSKNCIRSWRGLDMWNEAIGWKLRATSCGYFDLLRNVQRSVYNKNNGRNLTCVFIPHNMAGLIDNASRL